MMRSLFVQGREGFMNFLMIALLHADQLNRL